MLVVIPHFNTFGPFRLDQPGRRLMHGGLEVRLNGRAFDVLCALVAAGGEIVAKQTLFQQVWPGRTVDENNLQVQISTLRKALGNDVIGTVPGRGYRITIVPHLETAPAWDPSGKPSIAVLPFTNMSVVPDQEYFADGMADDIIIELSRAQSFFVIARNSSFRYREQDIDLRHVAQELGVRYVLTGTVRRGVGRLLVTAQLIDTERAHNLWADKFDRSLNDMFDLQSEIASHVTKAVIPAVAAAELRRALRKPPESLDAWEAYQRGLWHASKYSVDDIIPARKFLQRAIRLDETLASAHTALAWVYAIEGQYFGLRTFEEAALLEAQHARMAVMLDPNGADAHGILAASLFNCCEFQTAWDHVNLAFSINPDCALAHHARGWLLMFSGRPSEGRDSLLLALRHDPRSRDVALRVQVSISYYFERNYEAAVDILRGTLADDPKYPGGSHRWLAAALGQLGKTNEAKQALGGALSNAPVAFDSYTRKRPPWFRTEDFEHMVDGLRKAGWEALP
jgi:adenylate cyclase